MNLRNSSTVVGYVAKEPELRYLPNGTAVLRFVVRNPDDYYDKKTEQWVERSVWFNFSVFARQAESLNKRLLKGDLVDVEFSIANSKKDADGKYKPDTYRVNRVTILSHSSNGTKNSAPKSNDTLDDTPPFF